MFNTCSIHFEINPQKVIILLLIKEFAKLNHFELNNFLLKQIKVIIIIYNKS